MKSVWCSGAVILLAVPLLVKSYEQDADYNYEDGQSRQLPLASSSSFVNTRLFNTSVALTVPLFSFTLPQRASQGSTVDLANQAIFGLFALLVTLLIFAVPVLFSGVRPPSDDLGRQYQYQTPGGILNNLMSAKPVFNFMGVDLQHKIGLDWEKCLQKTVCEAHFNFNSKKKRRKMEKGSSAGQLLGRIVRVFVPSPKDNSTISPERHPFSYAAFEGNNLKQANNCGKEFMCFFDVLDLAQYLVDWYHFRSSNNNSNNDNELRKFEL